MDAEHGEMVVLTIFIVNSELTPVRMAIARSARLAVRNSGGEARGSGDSVPAMDIQQRPARPTDLDFARALYFETMRGLIEPLFGWDERHQEESFKGWFDLEHTSIIMADGRDVGWMHTRADAEELFLGSLDVIPDMQRRGIGTHVLRELIAHSERSSQPLTLAVMKNNPAIHLYERLGFRLIREDRYKFYMRVSPGGAC
jgi:ribosomal protein S18 acetylase RimI-like enzyme